MTPSKRYTTQQAKARQRRRRNAQECFERDRCQAQQATEALEKALHDLGLPGELGAEDVPPSFKGTQEILSNFNIIISLETKLPNL